jgi:5-formaminoimidazole-4-carboxamide-1-(beta)-D-ribofuranosyl 5'-monophosphate synthetase
MMPTVATVGSHSALQILKGAKQEGLKTILLCLKGREELYSRYSLADKTIVIEGVKDLLSTEVQQKLLEEEAILVPHGTLVSVADLERLEKEFRPSIFGNRHIFRWESDRDLKDALLTAAGVRVPRKFDSYDEIDGLAIVKLPGAEGGRGYFIVRSPQQFEKGIKRLLSKGLMKKGEEEKAFIQEYIVGVTVYPHYFYSPLTGVVELLGCDRRYETSIDALGRISARDQLDMDLLPTFRVIGNTPVVLRESLLMDVFKAGEGFVKASRELVPPGSVGPFCLEMVCDEEGRLYTFEFSGRIVAGTNLYVGGSPYSDLLYDEPMSMGRRIAREICLASERGELTRITT